MINTYTMTDFDLVTGERSMELRVLIESNIHQLRPKGFRFRGDRAGIRRGTNVGRIPHAFANHELALNKIPHYFDNTNVSSVSPSIFPSKRPKTQIAAKPKDRSRTPIAAPEQKALRIAGCISSESTCFLTPEELKDAT